MELVVDVLQLLHHVLLTVGQHRDLAPLTADDALHSGKIRDECL